MRARSLSLQEFSETSSQWFLALALFLSFTSGAQAQTGSSAQPGSQAQVEELTEAEAILQGMQNQAELLFTSGQQAESILAFRKVLEFAQKLTAERPATPVEKKVIVQSHFLRAQAFFNLGNLTQARADLRVALRLEPSLDADPSSVSPKLLSFLDEVRREELGTLVVDSEPSGAEVYMDDERVGLTPLYSTQVYKGIHQLEVRLRGYESYLERVTVLADQQLQRNVALTRVTGELLLYSQPTGARVYLDDELIGTTESSPSPEDCVRFGDAFDCAELSGPFSVPFIQPGIHTLRLEKRCFETRLENVSVESETRELTPFLMGPSRGTLKVESPLDGARVFLDGTYLGTTPIELEDGACAGDSELLVEKEGVGRWFDTLSILANRVTEVSAPPRPTLAYLGLVPHAERVLTESTQGKLLEQLQQIESINLRLPEAETLRKAMTNAGLSRLGELLTTLDSRNDLLGPRLELLARELDADLLLVARFPVQKLQTAVELFLFSSLHTKPDIMRVQFQNPLEWQKFNDAMQKRPELFRSWIGLVSVDRLFEPGCGIIQVSPASPAQKAGILPGDGVLEVDGQAVANHRSFRDTVQESKPGKTMSLGLESAGKPRSVKLTVGETPVQVPTNEPGVFYNKWLSELLLTSKAGSKAFTRNFALMNVGLVYMHFENWQKAVDLLGRVQFETRSGITNGTVHYYLAECLRTLGYSQEARAHLQKAVTFLESTLETNDGPLVHKLARKRLEELP